MKKILYFTVLLLLIATISYTQSVTPKNPFVSGTLKGIITDSSTQKYNNDTLFIDLREWDLANVDTGVVVVGIDSVARFGPRASDSLGWAAINMKVIAINRYPLMGEGFFRRTFKVNDTIKTVPTGKILTDSIPGGWNVSRAYTWEAKWPVYMFIIGYNFADTSKIYKRVETNYFLNFGVKKTAPF